MKINEDEFLHKLFQKIKVDGTIVVPPGDDCAAISLDFLELGTPKLQFNSDNASFRNSISSVSKNKKGEILLLITADQLSEEIHYFSQSTKTPTPAKLAGRKLLARSASDIAAMGGTPKYALVCLSVGPDYDQLWIEQFTEGILSLAQDLDINIIGGDLAAARANVSSLTLLGWVTRNNICLRNQANVNDRIFVTGEFGASLLTGKHLHFKPRIDEALWLTDNGYTRAMIDISDGLLKDLNRINKASNLNAVVEDNLVPRTRLNEAKVSLADAYLDGEDYELLLAVSPSRSHFLVKRWPFSTPITEIGHFIKPTKTRSILNEKGVNLLQKYGGGFNHFS